MAIVPRKFVKEEYVEFQRTLPVTTRGFIRPLCKQQSQLINDVVQIINDYAKSSFAKVFYEWKDTDYKKKMKYMDLVIYTEDKDCDQVIMIMNENKKLEKVGTILNIFDKEGKVDVTIPFLICKHLANAPFFYSKAIDYIFSFRCLFHYHFRLNIKIDDNWITTHLQGPLIRQYPNVQLDISLQLFSYGYRSLFTLNMSFGNNWTKEYSTFTNVTAKNIEELYQSRSNKTKLAKIKVKCRLPLDYIPKLWTYQYDTNTNYCYYVGPAVEKDKMMNKLNKYHKYNSSDFLRYNEYTHPNYVIEIMDVKDTDTFDI